MAVNRKVVLRSHPKGPVSLDNFDIVEEDLVRTESIAVPIILLLMIFVFGSVVAAGLPIMIAILSILGSFFFGCHNLHRESSVLVSVAVPGAGVSIISRDAPLQGRPLLHVLLWSALPKAHQVSYPGL